MASRLVIRVIGNGEIFEKVFNAVSTFMGTHTFQTAVKISLVFAIIAVVFNYIKGRDLTIFAKWFVGYVIIVVMIASPKALTKDIIILDSTEPSVHRTVDNVPLGIAFPASLITSIGYGLTRGFTDIFHETNDEDYNRAGFLFGAKLFRLSTGAQIIDPDTKSLFSEYTRNCVIGDILINNKYSLSELTNSRDLWTLITKKPSTIRGLYVDNAFKTCLEATQIIDKKINDDIKNNGFVFLTQMIMGKKSRSGDVDKIRQYLRASYEQFAEDHFKKLGSDATKMFMQNVMISALQEGIVNYATEAGATAALLSVSSEKSMAQMRMAWATSKNVIAYTLPLLQTIILLLLICLFPIVVLLAIQPVIGLPVIKNYFYTIIWVSSWSIMFTALHYISSVAIASSTGDLASAGVTMSNVNRLALKHSDLANLAGYMAISIPFISLGLVRGLSSALNSAAGSITGMVGYATNHSASEAASGNFSLGNVSLNNLSHNNTNANKFDTNATYREGMFSNQLSNGVIENTMQDGRTIIDASGTQHKVPITMTNEESYAITKRASQEKAISDMHSAVEKYAQENNVSYSDSLRKHLGANAGIDAGKLVGTAATFVGAAVGGPVGAAAGKLVGGALDIVKGGVGGGIDSSSETRAGNNYSKAISQDEQKQFRSSFNTLTDYSNVRTERSAVDMTQQLVNNNLGADWSNTIEVAALAAKNRGSVANEVEAERDIFKAKVDSEKQTMEDAFKLEQSDKGAVGLIKNGREVATSSPMGSFSVEKNPQKAMDTAIDTFKKTGDPLAAATTAVASAIKYTPPAPVGIKADPNKDAILNNKEKNNDVKK